MKSLRLSHSLICQLLLLSGIAASPVRATDLAVSGNLSVSGTSALTGYVGIGTPTALTRLHVNDGTNRNFLVVTDAVQLGTAGIAIGSFSDGATSYKPLSILGSIISIYGNVGIGTTSPVNKLDVRYGITAATTDYVESSSGSKISMQLNAATGNVPGFIQAYTAGSTALGNIALNPSGGNVGIGTTSPASTLQVVGNFGIAPNGTTPELYPGSIHISQPLASGQSLSMSKPGYYPWSIGWVYNTTTFGIGTSQTTDSNFTNPQFVINTSGNVGIGTTSPGSYKLAVNGTIHAREVVVDLSGWSDYVFADDYRLAPLSEVEANIKAEKHLPGIPSAAEVAQGGVSLGAMQARLLAKVEELTLHVIAQEKRYLAQEKRNDAQQAEIADLRAQLVRLSTPN